MAKEIIIVGGLLVPPLVFIFLLRETTLFGNASLDINLHDTYFVVKPSWGNSIFLPFLWLLIFVYLIRCAINKFNDSLQNLILLITCAALNVMMLSCFKQVAFFKGATSHGWTIYPPLSALSQHTPSLPAPDSPFAGVLEVLFTIQIILLMILVIIAFITGKKWNSTKNAL